VPTEPLFSIVIPTRNRPASLLDCVQAICLLEYPANRFEVIVVDDGGEPPLESVASIDRRRINLVFLRQDPRGPAAARNAGAAHARGRYLVFTDDDCRPGSTWLQRLEGCLAGTENSLVAGCARNAVRYNPYSAATQVLVDYMNLYYNSRPANGRFLTSNNIAMPRDRFLEIGGFDSTFRFAAGEDREFCERWRQHGLHVRYRRDCVVGHVHSLNFSSYLRQHFNYGRGAYRFHYLSQRRSASQVRFEPLSFYSNLILHPWSISAPFRSAKLVTLMAFSQVANVAGYLYESVSRLSYRICSESRVAQEDQTPQHLAETGMLSTREVNEAPADQPPSNNRLRSTGHHR